MDSLKDQIRGLSGDDWGVFLAWVVNDERGRRESLPFVEDARVSDRDGLWETHPELKPAFAEDAPDSTDDGVLFPAYVQPTGAHDSYPLGAGVSEGGKNYVSEHPANVWSPSSARALWREVPVSEPKPGDDKPVEPEVLEFVQPTGAHDAYGLGDRVLFEGVVYESLIPANTYSPIAYPPGWTEVE